MILSKEKFKTSVNIKLDLGSNWIQEKYIPTPTHIESLTGILQGFLNYGGKSHIIVGSYGSGKSMIGTLISNIVSKKVPKKELDNLIQKFENVNVEGEEVTEILRDVKGLNKVFIPVVVNGNQGRFREVVLSSIYNTLKDFDVDLTLPYIVEEIKSQIQLWEDFYYEAYEKFNGMLQEMNWDIASFLKDVEEFNIEAIEWFKEKYPILTSGAKLAISYNLDIVEHISKILDLLDARGYGLFLVYDEFGRFLQSIDKYQTVEAMQDIQDIAELADHHDSENFNVLLITHRNLNQYFLSYSEDLQKEFQRIQGRFRLYQTNSDPATFIRLASQITEDYRSGWDRENIFENDIIKFDLFLELNGREKKTIIVENSYPLHPVTLFALPRFANVVAQNERTLFTYLESNEIGGLKRYFESEKTWYYVHHLFDYFEPSFVEFANDSLIGKTYYKYVRVQKRVGKSSTAEDEKALLKLITLWDIASLTNYCKLDRDFIAFSLNWTLNKVDKIINCLEKKKLIRYRLFDGNWEVFEGSSVDINQKIEETRRNGIDKEEKLELLMETLDSRYAYPKSYNDKKNMIRFATIYPVYASDINEKCNVITNSVSDMNIIYVIPDLDIKDIKDNVIELSKKDRLTIYVLPHHQIVDLDNSLAKLASIEKLLEDKYFLSEDAIVEEELLKIKENTVFSIREFLEPITKFKQSYWIHNGIDLKIKSTISLSENLSEIIGGIFHQTPVMNNESFNRRNISKQQLKAAKEVVDAILGLNGNVDNLKGPSNLIYASIVKKNKINEHDESEEIQALRNDLIELINPGKGDFKTLLDVFKKEPYGIREPNIPVLLTSILKREWKYLIFYHRDGSYINDLDGHTLYDRMLEKPENYTFSYQTVDKKYIQVAKMIEECFSSYIEKEEASYHPAIRINRLLSRWFRSLPKITQKTNKLSVSALNFKHLIRKGEFEPDSVFEEIYDLGFDIDSIKSIKFEIEEYCQQHRQLIEKTIFQATNQTSFDDLLQYVQGKDEVVKVDNSFYNIILKSDRENWIDNLAINLVEVNREDWSDATDEVFFKTVTTLIESENKSELKEEYYELKMENKTMAIPKVDLSSKGKVIYSNIKTDLELMGRKLPKDEIKNLLFQLLIDYYDENI